jgi:hypothetical protein
VQCRHGDGDMTSEWVRWGGRRLRKTLKDPSALSHSQWLPNADTGHGRDSESGESMETGHSKPLSIVLRHLQISGREGCPRLTRGTESGLLAAPVAYLRHIAGSHHSL